MRLSIRSSHLRALCLVSIFPLVVLSLPVSTEQSTALLQRDIKPQDATLLPGEVDYDHLVRRAPVVVHEPAAKPPSTGPSKPPSQPGSQQSADRSASNAKKPAQTDADGCPAHIKRNDNPDNPDNKPECGICMEGKETQDLMTTKCGHIYCKECWTGVTTPWIQQARAHQAAGRPLPDREVPCPDCRKTVDPVRSYYVTPSNAQIEAKQLAQNGAEPDHVLPDEDEFPDSDSESSSSSSSEGDPQLNQAIANSQRQQSGNAASGVTAIPGRPGLGRQTYTDRNGRQQTRIVQLRGRQ